MSVARAAEVILMAAGAYAAAGAVFAGIFLARGVGAVDPAAGRSGWGFRTVILPGVAALWPVLALKWIRATREDGR